jgi:hypothetical protein
MVCDETGPPGPTPARTALLGRGVVFAGFISAASDPGDVSGEEVDAVAVKVAARSVVVLSGPGVGVPCENLRVAERDSGIEGVGDGGVPQ